MKDIAHGDADAETFLLAFYAWVHKQDDLLDRDKPVDAETSVRIDLQMFYEFGANPFFQRHQGYLWPLIMTSALAYLKSEEWRTSPDIIDRITAQVLKSEYFNVFVGVAHCAGGFEHAASVSRAYRDYDFDSEPPMK